MGRRGLALPLAAAMLLAWLAAAQPQEVELVALSPAAEVQAAAAAPPAAEQAAAAPAPEAADEALPAPVDDGWDIASMDAAAAALQLEQSRGVQGSSAAASGSQLQDDGSGLPADVAALLGPDPSSGGSTGASASDDGEQAPTPLPEPGQRTSEGISLLAPPAGVQLPPLTQEQRDAIPRLRQSTRQGSATISYLRRGYLNDHYKKHFVGLPAALFRKGLLCGACVRLWCVDSICEDALVANDLFMVTDSCQDCRGADLVISSQGFKNLTGGVDLDRNPSLQVAWTFASCAPLIEGGIRMLPSDRTTSQFLGLQFSNLKALLKSVQLNGLSMQRTDYGYWVLDTPNKPLPIRPPYTLVLTSTQGQRLEARLPNLRAQQLPVNFS